jgi:Protein of unknown function (DUF2786)
MSELDRITKLIALSGSGNEHEARSAAFLACKLIREGGYRVVAAEPDDPWADAFAAAAQAAQAQRAEWARRQRPPAPPPADRRPRRAVPSAVARARRSGVCEVCREPYEEGSDVALPTLEADAKLGAVHADCRGRWSVPEGP